MKLLLLFVALNLAIVTPSLALDKHAHKKAEKKTPTMASLLKAPAKRKVALTVRKTAPPKAKEMVKSKGPEATGAKQAEAVKPKAKASQVTKAGSKDGAKTVAAAQGHKENATAVPGPAKVQAPTAVPVKADAVATMAEFLGGEKTVPTPAAADAGKNATAGKNAKPAKDAKPAQATPVVNVAVPPTAPTPDTVSTISEFLGGAKEAKAPVAKQSPEVAAAGATAVAKPGTKAVAPAKGLAEATVTPSPTLSGEITQQRDAVLESGAKAPRNRTGAAQTGVVAQAASQTPSMSSDITEQRDIMLRSKPEINTTALKAATAKVPLPQTVVDELPMAKLAGVGITEEKSEKNATDAKHDGQKPKDKVDKVNKVEEHKAEAKADEKKATAGVAATASTPAPTSAPSLSSEITEQRKLLAGVAAEKAQKAAAVAAAVAAAAKNSSQVAVPVDPRAAPADLKTSAAVVPAASTVDSKSIPAKTASSVDSKAVPAKTASTVDSKAVPAKTAALTKVEHKVNAATSTNTKMTTQSKARAKPRASLAAKATLRRAAPPLPAPLPPKEHELPKDSFGQDGTRRSDRPPTGEGHLLSSEGVMVRTKDKNMDCEDGKFNDCYGKGGDFLDGYQSPKTIPPAKSSAALGASGLVVLAGLVPLATMALA